MSVLSLSATLSVGDGCGGGWSGGCAGSPGDLTIALGFGSCPKAAAASVYVPSRSIASPASFVTLAEVGPAATVKQGDFLYLSTNGAIDVRLTNDDGAGSTTVQTIRVQGLLLLEFPPTKPLELLEVQGSAQIAYLVSGPS